MTQHCAMGKKAIYEFLIPHKLKIQETEILVLKSSFDSAKHSCKTICVIKCYQNETSMDRQLNVNFIAPSTL